MQTQIILVEDVPNLGSIGALVSVAPGYARNYLVPQKKAVFASTQNKAEFEHQKRVAAFDTKRKVAAAQAAAQKLGALPLSIARKVGDQDKMFGSVTAHDVHEALAAKGIAIDRRKIHLPEAIKALGTFEVPVRLDGDVRATLKLTVVAE